MKRNNTIFELRWFTWALHIQTSILQLNEYLNILQLRYCNISSLDITIYHNFDITTYHNYNGLHGQNPYKPAYYNLDSTAQAD